MTSSIKLAAFDVDGTLVDKEGILLPQTEIALRRALAQGIRIILATGRAYHGVKHLVQDLGLVDPLILDNGALVTTAQGEVIWQEPFPTRDTSQLLDYCHSLDLTIVAFTTADLIYVFIPHPERDQERVLRDIDSFGLYNRRVVGNFKQLPRENVLKIMISGGDPRQVLGCAEQWPSHLRHLTYGLSLPLWLEINGEGVDKAKALDYVAASLGIPATAALAAGDGETDIPMLKWAQTGVLVQDGGVSIYDGHGFPPPRPVKEAAAWALEEFVLV